MRRKEGPRIICEISPVAVEMGAEMNDGTHDMANCNDDYERHGWQIRGTVAGDSHSCRSGWLAGAGSVDALMSTA